MDTTTLLICPVGPSAVCDDRWFLVAGAVMLKQSPEKPARNRIDLSTKELALWRVTVSGVEARRAYFGHQYLLIIVAGISHSR